MRKLIWIYGIVAGLIVSLNLFLGLPAEGEALSFEGGETRGFIMMTLAFALIFVAVQQLSKRFFDSKINFGKSFIIGLYISLIASIMYLVSWEYILANYLSDFAEQYMEYRQQTLVASGADAQEIEQSLAFEKPMMEMYKTHTFYRLALTFSEIFPLGLLVSLLAGLLFGVFLKKK
ncbi:MAG: hypothetical protein DA405_08705 [Bacteroidetes bacterium]|nr:MAG: hypothetical protein DA405_08705 [Bacteroidota bacterium]